jgi:hypothetical protein
MKCRLGNMTSLYIAAAVLVLGAGTAGAQLDLEPPVTIQDGGADLWVPGYSVPSFAHWDADGLKDLIVGEGGGGYINGMVRIYRNVGTEEVPAFAGYVYAMADGQTLVWPASGCMGLFPRVVNWDGDGRKDLLIGTTEGAVRIYLNVGTDEDPQFDAGAFVQAGLSSPVDIDVGSRAKPIWVDWNLDGRNDLLCGALDGRLRLYLDTAVMGEPQLDSAIAILEGGAHLIVPGGRSSPGLADFDGDGLRDLLVGNTAGEILLYTNEGSNAEAIFTGYTQVFSNGEAIDLPGDPRSRPSVCDWTNCGRLDVWVGSADGLVYFYEGPENISPVPMPYQTLPMVAYPNPFNPRVNIEFMLAEPQQVELVIYSVAGRLVATLAGGNLPAGEQRFIWDGRDNRGGNLPSGQYIVRMRGSRTDERRKVTLLR